MRCGVCITSYRLEVPAWSSSAALLSEKAQLWSILEGKVEKCKQDILTLHVKVYVTVQLRINENDRFQILDYSAV